MVYVGIDITYLKHDCTIVTEHGAILKDGFAIGNDFEGFKNLMKVMRTMAQSRKQQK